MYLLNNDYNEEDFKWKNQSITALASSLFKIQNGYLPDSSYSSRVLEILDKFEPRALYFCDANYFDKDDEDDKLYKHFDICKSYLQILIKNEQPIPIYSINNIRNLEKTGEFYIDEVILEKYNCGRTTEASFYSSYLVKYLVQVLKMDRSNIKYKITTNKALKLDTFKTFIEYIFYNFEEKQPELLASCFMGHLGTKYNKTNNGFTSQD